MEENQANIDEESPKEQTGPKHIFPAISGARSSARDPMWQCPVCGARIWITNRKRHLSTRKHLDAQYVLKEKFEIF